jgi:hypothetical protein
MSDRSPFLFAAVAAVLAAIPGRGPAQTVITQWSFPATQAAPVNSPAPSTGSGTAAMLGMTNSYNGGNTASGDVLATPGIANPSFSENTWRIRGTAHNGWATYQNGAGAPQYSQGIELDASTAGFTNVQFSFDWFSTNQAIRDLQLQYNTNVANSTGWTNFGGTSPTGTYIATPGDFYNAPNSPTITVDLSSVAGANNDPTFGIRLVSAFDSTGNVANDYAGATLATGGQTQIYNNSSGNWRFDNLTFTGAPSAVPEPSTALLAGAAAAGLTAVRRRQKPADPA